MGQEITIFKYLHFHAILIYLGTGQGYFMTYLSQQTLKNLLL